MADAASISITATMLPDEVAKTVTGSMTVTPVSGDKWYYKLTTVTTTSAALIAGGSYFTSDAIATSAGHDTIATGDKIKFLYMKNTDPTNNVYVNQIGAAHLTSAGSMFLPPGETLIIRSPNTTINTLDAIAQTASCVCMVIALLTDIG